MNYVMFLDDIRDPAWVYPDQDTSQWMVCRSYAEAVAVISDLGIPELISFDHDLGESDAPTGMDLARYLVNLDMDTQGAAWPSTFEYRVHSANVAGAANIRGLLDAYVQHKG